MLTEVIVERDQLATIDLAADAAVPRDVGTIWYVRVLLRPRGLEDSLGEVGWAVIEDDTAAVLASDPERTSEESETSRPGAGPSPSEEAIAIPERMLGLEVLDVETAQRLAANEVDPARLVAIDGWLTVAPDEPGCAELPVVACPRRGDLSGTREPGGPMLAVETLAGTPLLGLTRQSPSLGTWTVPNRVALVGHFRVTPSGPVFTIERLAWLRTAARQRPVLTAPGSLATAWSREAAEAAARASVEGAGSTLLFALLDRPTLRRFDGLAAAAVGATGGPVWYLRTIVWQPGPGGEDMPVVGWSVVDDRTHEVLATGLWPDAP